MAEAVWPPDEAILRLDDVLPLIGLSRASVYALAREGKFPASVKITDHATGWRVGDIRAWLFEPTGWSAGIAPPPASELWAMLARNRDAWAGEEYSVRREHAELIRDLDALMSRSPV